MTEKFVATHLRLIEKERDAEIEETRVLTEKLPAKELERRGVCITKLCITGRRTGYYGRIVITFQPKGAPGRDLPAHSFTPGDIVGLVQAGVEQSEDVASGIVTKVISTSICVAFDEKEDLFSLDDDGTYRLQKLANDVTYKRLKKALRNLQTLRPCPASQMVGVLFAERQPTPPYQLKDVEYINKNLDDSQREAVRFALSQPEIAVVHGPPGTGKTTTVVEIITQAVKQGMKVLACAPSNIAVDNLVERLARNKQKIVRLGHPARVLPHIQKYSLDAILSNSNETRLVEDVRKDLDKTLSKLKKTRDGGERQSLRTEQKLLRKELNERAEAATKEILKRADVILATLTSASEDGPLKYLDESHFKLAVIDECSQAVEAACWIPLLKAPRCVLAGDHLQLPPTILSHDAATDGLARTLMERVIDLYDNKVVRMLTTQYRMHHLIMQWSSVQLYHSKLTAHPTVREHLLSGLQGVNTEEAETDQPLVFIDTAGCELYELDVPEEISKGNEGEADIVEHHVKKLIQSCGLKQEDIAVIAPYNLQVELMRLRIWPDFPNVEIKSVDGFQGREKEAVVISLVRSNKRGEVGFLSEKRRINVAVTRARRHLMVVCDSETVSRDEFLQSMVDYMMTYADVRTAQEYIQEGVVNNQRIRPDHLEDLMNLKTANQGKGARPKSSAGNTKKDKKNRPDSKKKNSVTTESKPKLPVLERNDDDATQQKIKEFQGYLDKFNADENSYILEFPSTLTSFERLMVHELSEKLGFTHVSKGQDKERHIVVSKRGCRGADNSVTLQEESATPYTENQSKDSISERNTGANNEISPPQAPPTGEIDVSDEISVAVEMNTDESLLNSSDDRKVEKASDKLTCPHCKKEVIRANYSLHEIHCVRQQREQNRISQEKSDISSKRNSAKKKSSQKIKASRVNALESLEKIDADDFDALISASHKLDSDCCYTKCKVKVLTLGQNCEFCTRRFCLSHHIPEVHGCGDAAKAQARAVHIREGILYRSSITAPPLPDPKKKAALQKKLDKKISDMASSRQSGRKSKK